MPQGVWPISFVPNPVLNQGVGNDHGIELAFLGSIRRVVLHVMHRPYNAQRVFLQTP
jgi:hypothetical protein